MSQFHWAFAVIAMTPLLNACGGGGGGGGGGSGEQPPVQIPPTSPTPSPPPTPTPTPTPDPTLISNPFMDPAKWEIGPIVNGSNYSVGVPLRPFSHPEGWSIDLPQPSAEAGHVHYVTTPVNSLAGKTRIVIKYRIEADPGVKILPRTDPNLPSLLTLYFQRSGDNWSGAGAYETYRWWATFRTHVDLTPGEYEMTARLDENWTAIMYSTAQSSPSQFDAARMNASRVGFTLGGGDGYGHGIFATGPAKLIVTDFRIE